MATDKVSPGRHRRRFPRTVIFGLVGAAALVFMHSLLDTERVRVTSAQSLEDYFIEIDYPAKALRTGEASVPRLLVNDIPDGWDDGLTVSERKGIFFRTLLPMVLIANEEIRNDRRRLARLRDGLRQGNPTSAKDREWLTDLAARYRMPLENADTEPDEQFAELLLRRVDIIPPSLALAQAAIESAYGSSRFAVEGNALFGQWTFGNGLVPQNQREQLGDHRVAAFDTPLEAVRAYMRNLNTNPAYLPFRNARAGARDTGDRPRGSVLAAGLEAYSEKGRAYVSLVRSLIAQNLLSATDSARLRDMSTVRIAAGPI